MVAPSLQRSCWRLSQRRCPRHTTARAERASRPPLGRLRTVLPVGAADLDAERRRALDGDPKYLPAPARAVDVHQARRGDPPGLHAGDRRGRPDPR
jgi:hypothetical protein